MSYNDDGHNVSAEEWRNSRIPGFYDLDRDERLDILKERGFLDAECAEHLRSTGAGLDPEDADQMIENAIGVFELPLGVGLNFRINDSDFVVPMAIEEPSVLAAVSNSAKVVRAAGGFESECEQSLMLGQIQVVDVPEPEAAADELRETRSSLISRANELHPKMVDRGGGATDLEVRRLERHDDSEMLVVHLLVDVCDAMGANLVNSMVEGIAPAVEEATEGRVSLRILSNLADQRLVHSQCRIPIAQLAWKDFSGREVADGIEEASEFAELDPYRAATHNKGIMNGMGAVCIATGNDWRALEAGAHAYCCENGQYRPMATWSVEEEKGEASLVGRLTVPVQLGTVGGPVRLHPTVEVAREMLDVSGACELGEVVGAVGLAQNLGALRALATEGIQRGHMSLHARSVAASAGAETDEIDEVVERLIESGDINLTNARRILADVRPSGETDDPE
jgi:hydroxymethylglutaryl-CoA reductase